MNQELEKQLFHQYMINTFKYKDAKPLFLLVGRTASGKSTLEAQLNNIYKAEPIKSYTTRPARPNDDTHTFVDQQGFDDIRNNLVAYTKINDYEYGVTANQLIRGSFYVIDPVGVESLINSGFFNRQKHIYPVIIHLDVLEDVRLERFLKRGGTKEDFFKRQHSEDIVFAPLASLHETNTPIITIDGTNELSVITRQVSTLYKTYSQLLQALKPYWLFNTTIADGLMALGTKFQDRNYMYKQSVDYIKEDIELITKRVQNLDLEPMISVSEMENCSIEEMSVQIERENHLMKAFSEILFGATDILYYKVRQNELSLNDATIILDTLCATLTLNLSIRTDEFLERIERLKIKYKDTLNEVKVSPSITRDDIPTHLISLPKTTSDGRTPKRELEIALYLPEHILNAINPGDIQLLIQALDANVSTFLEDPARYRQILEQAIPRKKG